MDNFFIDPDLLQDQINWLCKIQANDDTRNVLAEGLLNLCVALKGKLGTAILVHSHRE
jgi:hypothetical protein